MQLIKEEIGGFHCNLNKTQLQAQYFAYFVNHSHFILHEDTTILDFSSCTL